MRSLLPFVVMFLILVSCGTSPEQLAKLKLEEANSLLKEDKFNEAKLIIDSLSKIYPDEFEVVAAGKKLMLKVELIEQMKSIVFYDSLLLLQEQNFQELKRQFVLKPGDPGQYIHKRQKVSNSYNRTYIQAHVNENGEFYISSRFHGQKNIHHNSIKVYNEGLYAQTAVIEKGINNRSFDDGGEIWETVNYTKGTDNGVVSFIVNNSDDRLKVMYRGRNPHYIVMEKFDKEAVRMAYDLGQIILSIKQLESDLAQTKKRAETLKQQLEI